ncbi:histidinol-phosphate phosphatase family protein [Catenuloplanes nepalensis]|uniref:D,D-heptose 1,7-bisphosphate phosphatase n=1 Tax=Catenuloplanes nepalensis TaxID=587533 RepID=A0ABT9MMU2_9ACTN|nr:HAD-IIIA family hydrolase [Catenuloplanes nepalensis]MDP9792718.1 histidinol-phosphate phosphatase family protein [Catenuloplanes nepalensis]
MTALYDAVLFDRDGTLVVDVPYNDDPELVRPMPGARAALDRLRAAGLRLGVVTNQSGLARGRFTRVQLDAVNARVEELLGPFGTWQICPHDDRAGCRCRKPAPGMVVDAAVALGADPRRCVMVGDIGRDMRAAAAAGAAGVLIPTEVTLAPEIAAAPAVAETIGSAVDLILDRIASVTPAETRKAGKVLVVRADSAGDVLVTGPAIRAVAAHADEVVLLCGPRGRDAAALLPGVGEIVEARLPWIVPDPEPVDAALVAELTATLTAIGADEAVIFTSFHQNALPLALLLRAAGVARITAISEDYPGSLLDVRHRGVPPGVPEPERARSIAAAAGFTLPPGDDGALHITLPPSDAGRPAPGVPEQLAGRSASGVPEPLAGQAAGGEPGGAPLVPGAGEPPAARAGGPVRGGYVVVHPGASVQARSCPPEVMWEITAGLVAAGHDVRVTGGPGERELAAFVAGAGATLAESTDLAGLARLLAGAACAVVANTGPAHLAAAVGTPVVSLFAPTVPYGQWGPYRVPHVRLGDAAAACRESRATRCPVAGHPCLSTITPDEVLAAVRTLTPHHTIREMAA